MKIPRKRFSDEIAQAIRVKIDELGLKEGDRLPSHACLAKELNVSIPSLREGFQVLTTLGLLRIDHGKGTVVSSPSVSDYFRILNPVLTASARSSRDYGDILRLLGVYAIEQAGKDPARDFEGELARIKDALEERDSSRFARALRKFFCRLGEASGNSVVREILDILSRVVLSDVKEMSALAERAEGLAAHLTRGEKEAAGEEWNEILDSLMRESPASPPVMTLSTGSIGGSFYTVGTEICRLVNERGELYIKAEPSGGGVENVNLTGCSRDVLSLTQSDVAERAFKGPNRDIRAVCGTHSLDLWIFARKGSGINSLKDCRGKRIAIGAVGGESSGIARTVLGSLGYTESDYFPSFLSISNTVQAIREGTVDAAFYLTKGAGSVIGDLIGEKRVKLLGFNSRQMNRLLSDHPTWKESVIGKDTRTLSISSLLIAHKDFPEEGVIALLEAMGVESDQAVLDGVSIELHRGARRYFTERGIIHD